MQKVYLESLKTILVSVMALATLSSTALADLAPSGSDRQSFTCDSSATGRIDFDFAQTQEGGVYYAARAIRYDRSGQVIEVQGSVSDVVQTLRASKQNGVFYIEVPSSQTQESGPAKGCFVPVAVPGGWMEFEESNPSQGRITLLADRAYRPGVEVRVDRTGVGWPRIDYYFDGKRCDQSEAHPVKMSLACRRTR